MRGNPPFQLTLVLIGFILMAVPLARLTFARTDIKPVNSAQIDSGATTAESSEKDCLLRARFAHQPKRLSILLGGNILMETRGSDSKSPIQKNIKLRIPREGVEVIVNAEWPEGTPETALTLEMEPDGLDTKSATRWSNGARINDVLSFSW